MRSLTFSPSPSCRRTFTLTESPGRNSGKSLRSCASCNLRITGFMFLVPCRPTQAGPALLRQTSIIGENPSIHQRISAMVVHSNRVRCVLPDSPPIRKPFSPNGRCHLVPRLVLLEHKYGWLKRCGVTGELSVHVARKVDAAHQVLPECVPDSAQKDSVITQSE